MSPKMRRTLRRLLAFAVAVVVTHVVASVCQSLSIMAALESAGAGFSFGTRMQVIAHDIVGLVAYSATPYGGCILLGFLIAIPLAAAGVRAFKLPGLLLYPLAGAASIAAILYFMQVGFFYHMTFMEGTRGTFGYGSQLAAGALGGLVFHLLAKRAAREPGERA